MKTHTLKTIGTCWDAVSSGEKRFEVRRNDRFFQTGDRVILRRLPDEGCVQYRAGPYQELTFRIGWILQGGQFGIEPGFCVFNLEPVSP